MGEQEQPRDECKLPKEEGINDRNAREILRIVTEKLLAAERRSSEVADEFIRLEVQIATILFALAALFLNCFDVPKLIGISGSGVFLMKLVFSFSLSSLIASLTFGLLHLKRKEMFWDERLSQRILREDAWLKVIKGGMTFDQAEAYHSGTALDKGIAVSVPKWAWGLQSICLGIGVALLFALAIVYLFAHN